MMASVLSWPPNIWVQVFHHLHVDEVVRTRLVCKDFDQTLRPLVRTLCITVPISQLSLEGIARSYSNLVRLELRLEYEDDIPALNWSRARFPNLRYLTLDCCPMDSIYFTTENTPVLQSLSCTNQGSKAAKAFELRLPQLKRLSFEYVNVSTSLFDTHDGGNSEL